MQSPNLDAVDRQLAELGAVPSPAALAKLIQRYAGADVTLQNVDSLLDALGHAAPLPPRLQPTMVDAPAPLSADEPELAMSVPDDEPVVAEAAAPEQPEQEQPDAEPVPRSRLPWESEPASASPAALEAAAKLSAPPAPLPDLEGLFSDEPPPPPRISSVMPPEPPVLQPRRRHDTIEQMPSVAPRLAPMSALDLGDLGDTSAPAPAKLPSEVEGRVSYEPELSVSDAEEDEFEILVDDEILEVDDDAQ